MPETPAGRAAAAWLEHLAVEKGASGNTLKNYRRDTGRYLSWLAETGITDLAGVETATVEHYLLDLRRGDHDKGRKALSASSAARALVVARGLHRFAHLEGLTPTDPAADVAPPSQPRHLPDTLTVDEVARMLDRLEPGESFDPQLLRDRALLELLYGTGARVSEILALSVDDVTACGGVLKPQGKGNKQRIVPVGGPATAAVEAYLTRARPALSKGTTHRLFLNSLGRPLSRQSTWQIVKDAAARAGITKEVSPHTLRHSYATHLLDGGADVRTVQELLGHAAVTTTQIYTHVTADSLREVWAVAHPRAR